MTGAGDPSSLMCTRRRKSTRHVWSPEPTRKITNAFSMSPPGCPSTRTVCSTTALSASTLLRSIGSARNFPCGACTLTRRTGSPEEFVTFQRSRQSVPATATSCTSIAISGSLTGSPLEGRHDVLGERGQGVPVVGPGAHGDVQLVHPGRAIFVDGARRRGRGAPQESGARLIWAPLGCETYLRARGA